MTNRDLTVALITKYAPAYRVVFQVLSNTGEIVMGYRGMTDNKNKIVYLDPVFIDHASPTLAKIFVAHELGHVFGGLGHDVNWRRAVEQILVAEGLGQYANPKYYRRTPPAGIWKMHLNYELKKGRPQWPKF